MNSLARHFGARLRELRIGKGLTQDEMGKPRTYVCDVEAGRRDVRFSTVEHFASILHCDPWELFKEARAK